MASKTIPLLLHHGKKIADSSTKALYYATIYIRVQNDIRFYYF